MVCEREKTLMDRIQDLSRLVEPDRVRKEVYTDQQIFEREMERIHEKIGRAHV